ncbi:DUF4143 domain-containing protein [soil metagenome]
MYRNPNGTSPGARWPATASALTQRLGPGYRPRIVDGELDELLAELPAVAIEGPRGVGKTATALERARTVFLLDDAAQGAIIRADPTRIVEGDPPILIDEWQLLPESWDLVRRAVDAGAKPGRFLLTGSAAPTRPPTHSGAGRIVTLRMRPMSLAERGVGLPSVSLAGLTTGERRSLAGETSVVLEDYASEIVRSGFPALRGLGPRASKAQLDGYLERIVDRDLAASGYETRNPQALRRWLAAYAAASSTTASYEAIRAAASPGHTEMPARSTTTRYIDTLVGIWMVEPQAAWVPSGTHLGRLGLVHKHQLADPALAARLLGVDADALLEGRPARPPSPTDRTLFGNLFESLVTQSVRVYAQAAGARVLHLRTRNGDHEVDLIVQRDDGRIVALEVKLGRTVDREDTKHLRWLHDRIGESLLDAAIVTTGPAAYRQPDGIAVIPAALLGP